MEQELSRLIFDVDKIIDQRLNLSSDLSSLEAMYHDGLLWHFTLDIVLIVHNHVENKMLTRGIVYLTSLCACSLHLPPS